MNKRSKISILFCISHFVIKAQIMLNGSFVLGTSSWSCSAEINAETVYGGSNSSNAVAEVDAAAGLCQTVIGLEVGNVYTLSYDCTRRLGGCPSPDPTNMLVTIDGGALSKTDTRANGSFGWTTSFYNFTALSAFHTITFAAGPGFSGSTCGMIVDNVSVNLFSPLPIELVYFKINSSDEHSVSTFWETLTEANNDFFTVERSNNGLDWEIVATIKGAGTSARNLKYTLTDKMPYSGISYYRLKQTDFNGNYKYSTIQSIELNTKKNTLIYPNPSRDHTLYISSNETFPYNVILYNHLGEMIYSSPDHRVRAINLESVDAGIYYLSVYKDDKVIYKNKIILE